MDFARCNLDGGFVGDVGLGLYSEAATYGWSKAGVSRDSKELKAGRGESVVVRWCVDGRLHASPRGFYLRSLLQFSQRNIEMFYSRAREARTSTVFRICLL